jgi:hypothetical protein
VEHIRGFFYLFACPNNQLDARKIRLAGGSKFFYNVFLPVPNFVPILNSAS